MKKLAARVSRLIKSFWVKIDRIIAHKQRLAWQTSQRKVMDKHLIQLLQQTEKYTGALAERMKNEKLSVIDDRSIESNAQIEIVDQHDREMKIARPFLLDSTVTLRPYQQIGLNWLVSMHERRLNGILADEMGLGKTLQTIALLAYLAAGRGIWGPHLIVVPTSCLVNWESEIKRFCPGLKVLTYYGAAKARKQLRAGWSRALAVHVVITSYQLAVQDASIFRRKKFYYLILDEAHNIKNFDSRRWRTLLSFQTRRRLLLTGTPLQNSLMELWSLMHFLMPHLFQSRHEFSYWFASPLQCAVEGKSSLSDELLKRLHSIMRPFVLRRLKKDVAKQLPNKFEHELRCQLSRRQQLLYEEFMNHSKLHSDSMAEDGSFVSMMNTVMQLRKVCNHPDLFEPRTVVAPLFLPSLNVCIPLIARNLCFCLQPTRTSLNSNAHNTGGPFFKQGLGNMPSRHAESHFNAFKFLIRTFASTTPFSLAWNSIFHDSPILHDDSAGTQRRLGINRVRFVASDTLRTQLEQHATMRARYWNNFESLRRFAFVVPPALATVPFMCRNNHSDAVLCCSEVSHALAQIRHTTLALRVSFPDRSLLQWDSGKFHVLAPLLRRLKQGKHRCLIFTQMSKMLDVLEGFLCWHGHNYLRLDGGTPPDERQRLMTRFNSDTNAFCFVLSTRSGGLGINLTGADTVIFYDSDWNPAMDAQAMDRAHRIGQSRDVHIYRLICVSTIEENILLKARQKKKLEFMTFTEGNFSSRQLQLEKHAPHAGVPKESDVVAAAMAELEDESDAECARAAIAEAAADGLEFDDYHEVSKDEQSYVASKEASKSGEVPEAAWRQELGPDMEALTQSLSAVERHAMQVRQVQLLALLPRAVRDTAFLTLTERRLLDELKKEATEHETLNADMFESMHQAEEYRACAEGELSATDLYFAAEIHRENLYNADILKFLKRRRSAQSAKRKRECTGAAWEARVDTVTGSGFWYNVDTAEATWRTPLIIQRRDAYQQARRGGYGHWPREVSLHFMSMCEPTPTRYFCALVCRNWARAYREEHLLVKVLPSDNLDNNSDSLSRPCVDHRFYQKVHLSLRGAIKSILPGQTLILGPGHYFEGHADLLIDTGIRVIGDSQTPERVLVEISGAIKWRANNGVLAGMTLRRPRPCAKAMSALVVQSGCLLCHRLVVDNSGAGGAAISVGGRVHQRISYFCLYDSFYATGACVHLDRTTVTSASAAGVFLYPGSKATLCQCAIDRLCVALAKFVLETENILHFCSQALTDSIIGVKYDNSSSCNNNILLVRDPTAVVTLQL
mmetsp:Transcript_32203/g.99600  ORF Transcript_32203/g.99600 Transcript_32203/m.99600 type:complete len:1299 (+) Transcript_32203:1576-5472(+)